MCLVDCHNNSSWKTYINTKRGSFVFGNGVSIGIQKTDG